MHISLANRKLLVPGNWILHPSPLHGRVYSPPKMIDYATPARVYIHLLEPRPDGRKPFVNIKSVLLAFRTKEEATEVYEAERKMTEELDREVQKLRDKYQSKLRSTIRQILASQNENSGLQGSLFKV